MAALATSRLHSCALLLLLAACAPHRSAYVRPPILPTIADVAIATTTTATLAIAPHAIDGACEVDAIASDDEDGDGDESGELPEDRTPTGVDPGLRYSADLSDEDLARRWQNDPSSLGPISIGFAEEGRLINAQQFPAGDGKAWTLIMPYAAWTTAETITYVTAAAERVKSLHADVPPLRVNAISLQEGGWFRPHRSHQSGRDVDLGFYYATPEAPHCRFCEKLMDVAANWELVKSLVILADVQVILVDKAVQKVLYAHALSVGEDRAWLDSIFNAGKDSIVKHARRHRDHFHVRFFNPRAQELGRRVAPLLAQRPDQNLVMVRVKNRDNLGRIALRNKSSVRAIQKANHMRGTFLRVGQVLRVPMRGPCTRCPVPPAIEIPPRRIPPPSMAAVNP